MIDSLENWGYSTVLFNGDEGTAMKLYVPGMAVLLSLVLWAVSGCSILPPDLTVKTQINWKIESGILMIDYSFTNIGTVDMPNFQFSFGIDDVYENPGIVDYDHTTKLYPDAGTTLNVGETYSGTYNTGLNYAVLPVYVGIYEIGCDNPPD
ncbi:MAG: hypothetical protein P8107_14190 [Spirochaetia bacterium]